MNILVSGGAGYIGSHAVRALMRYGHDVVVVDDLSHGNIAAVKAAKSGFDREPGFIAADIGDKQTMEWVLRAYSVEAVMHFAGSIEVAESITDPLKYYKNNFGSTIRLLQVVAESRVRRFVFSSTAAVYGNPQRIPITEEHPLCPVNPYGRSKMMVETALHDFAAAVGIAFTILRYFNVGGADSGGGLGEAHEPETHLIPRALDAAVSQDTPLEIFGTDYPTRDGTCIRDYVHVEDLVDAHVLALEGAPENSIFNLGSENGFSVNEVIDTCSRIAGARIPVKYAARRCGDPHTLIASSDKVRRELGWKPKYPDLETIVRHAWAWKQSRHK